MGEKTSILTSITVRIVLQNLAYDKVFIGLLKTHYLKLARVVYKTNLW